MSLQGKIGSFQFTRLAISHTNKVPLYCPNCCSNGILIRERMAIEWAVDNGKWQSSICSSWKDTPYTFMFHCTLKPHFLLLNNIVQSPGFLRLLSLLCSCNLYRKMKEERISDEVREMGGWRWVYFSHTPFLPPHLNISLNPWWQNMPGEKEREGRRGKGVKGQNCTGYRLLQSGCSCTSTFETSLGWLYNPAL